MIRYKDGNPPRDLGQYVSSYRTFCSGVVIHLFRAEKEGEPNVAFVVRVNRKLDADTIAREVVDLQLGTWMLRFSS